MRTNAEYIWKILAEEKLYGKSIKLFGVKKFISMDIGILRKNKTIKDT